MKMYFLNNRIKIISIFTLIIATFLILKPSPESKIKQTVSKFWYCLQNNQFNESVDLFYEGKDYGGGLSMQNFYLKKNYKFIESQITPIDQIKIKDTILFFGAKMKYVTYIFQSNNPKIKPMKINFIFWKEDGYDKIINTMYLQNFIDFKEN